MRVVQHLWCAAEERTQHGVGSIWMGITGAVSDWRKMGWNASDDSKPYDNFARDFQTCSERLLPGSSGSGYRWSEATTQLLRLVFFIFRAMTFVAKRVPN